MSAIVKKSLLVLVSAILFLSMMEVDAQESGHLHHVHMNVSDIEQTTEFYQRIFGVLATNYNNRVPALMVERMFLFMNEMEGEKIVNHQLTGLTHLGWGTIDGNHLYQWLKDQGVEFYTPLSELQPGSTYMYLYGPDNEVIEYFDYFKHHRLTHIHIIAADAKETAQWFEDLIHPQQQVRAGGYDSWNISIDNVGLNILPIGARFTPRENDGTLPITDNSHLDHLAFSFRDLDAAYERIKNAGADIVKPLTSHEDYGFRHFFVRAPNGVLVEIVEANPWPQAAWEGF